jgi:hypothetical protein
MNLPPRDISRPQRLDAVATSACVAGYQCGRTAFNGKPDVVGVIGKKANSRYPEDAHSIG